MASKSHHAGFAIALGIALGTIAGVMAGHIAIWLGIGIMIGMLLGATLRRNEAGCPECALIHRQHQGERTSLKLRSDS
jgi:hypothetical protein